MHDFTERLNELATIVVARNSPTITEKRCKRIFKIFPVPLKKLSNNYFEGYHNSHWFSTVYIFQEKFSTGRGWYTMAVLDKDRAIEYLLER